MLTATLICGMMSLLSMRPLLYVFMVVALLAGPEVSLFAASAPVECAPCAETAEYEASPVPQYDRCAPRLAPKVKAAAPPPHARPMICTYVAGAINRPPLRC
jgi:hypothetical protein